MKSKSPFPADSFALTRFANNTIHQNVAEENHVVSVRTVFDGRTARAFTNKFDEESLRQVVRSSESLAKVQHPDPDLLPMPGAGSAGGARRRVCAITAFRSDCGHHSRVARRGREQDRRRRGCTQAHTAGVFSSGESVRRNFQFARTEPTGTRRPRLRFPSPCWPPIRQDGRRRILRTSQILIPLRLAEIAAKKAVDSGRPRDVPAGKYTVILEPAAVLDIVGFMFWDFSRHGDSRSALVFEWPHRHEIVRRQHQYLG